MPEVFGHVVMQTRFCMYHQILSSY